MEKNEKCFDERIAEPVLKLVAGVKTELEKHEFYYFKVCADQLESVISFMNSIDLEGKLYKF